MLNVSPLSNDWRQRRRVRFASSIDVPHMLPEQSTRNTTSAGLLAAGISGTKVAQTYESPLSSRTTHAEGASEPAGRSRRTKSLSRAPSPPASVTLALWPSISALILWEGDSTELIGEPRSASTASSSEYGAPSRETGGLIRSPSVIPSNVRCDSGT